MDRQNLTERIGTIRSLIAKADAELASAIEHVGLEQDRLALSCVEIAGDLIGKARSGSVYPARDDLSDVARDLRNEIQAEKALS